MAASMLQNALKKDLRRNYKKTRFKLIPVEKIGIFCLSLWVPF